MKTKTRLMRVVVYVEESVADSLRLQAEADGRTLSEYVRRLIETSGRVSPEAK